MGVDNIQEIPFPRDFMLQNVREGICRNRKRRIEMIEAMLGKPELFTGREYGILCLYFRAGLPQKSIAEIFKTSRPSITRSMSNAIKKWKSARWGRNSKQEPEEG